MAYLPPAGIRCLTDSKVSYLPTMSEIQNPAYTDKMLDAIKKNAQHRPTDTSLPVKRAYSDEIAFKPAKTFTEFDTYTAKGTWSHCKAGQPDLRKLPYGLPPNSFDVKIRANWFDHWKEQNYVYTGAFRQWEKRYGARYLYPTPVIPKPPRFTSKNTRLP
ncbi:unnamed protein product [Candidula unifasciata]|uniref:Uncharacterized protein n=1 Tax=Candidula unifasciata TaxID=100452 RepID=A0A8S3YJ96_9EUPU|nr:unnamed protein product [Candidula unifasciata]